MPAEELYKITGRDLEEAVRRWISGDVPAGFNDSTRFDLLVQDKRIPPKMIVALAAERPIGRVLQSTDFSGGESSAAFRLLLHEGFEIVTKPNNVRGLDASFSVGRNRTTDFVIVESRGPDRNVDYLPGLERILLGLADVDATLEGVAVESKVTGGMAESDRQVVVEGQSYPLRLRQLHDIGGFRRQMTRAVARTGRSEDSKGGGNPTKRLRLSFSTSVDTTMMSLVESLGGVTADSSSTGGFSFSSTKPMAAGGESVRQAQSEATITHVHAELQQRLYAELSELYGEENVSAENIMAVGNPADILVRTEAGYSIYEIKTSLLPRVCVRQAIGQLLEYGYWPRSPEVAELIVVGPSEIDSETDSFIQILCSNFGLKLRYRCVAERGNNDS